MIDLDRSAWPDRAHYARLVQNPDNFADEELRSAALALSRRGGPRVWSGARAMVFQAQTPDERLLAVRVFLNARAVDPARYAALSQHLEQHPVPLFVWTRWVDDGLVSDTGPLPLIKMQWVDGHPLDEYLAACLGTDRAAPTLAHMAEEWRRECLHLTSSDLAHGDIHAQNVLVCPGTAPGHIRYQLVDYDGVWTPTVNAAPNEVGHAAYQHPRHDPTFWGRGVDAFPATLVYLSLRALAADPGLWDRFHTDDTLLFRQEDLTAPGSTGLWAALAASRDGLVAALTGIVAQWLADRPDALHTLEEAIAAASARTARPPAPAATDSDPPNVWPPQRPPTPSPRGPQAWAGPRAAPRPDPRAGPAPAARQRWGPPPGGPSRGTRARGTSGQPWLWVALAVLVIAVVLVAAVAA
jgi:eukaryotic-like serine/threonine-protein kinase